MYMKKIYLSGQISGDKDFESKFANQEQKLKRTYGDQVVVLNPAIFPYGLSQHEYMQLSITMIDIADTVLMLNGWEQSEGAKVEKAYAEKCGKTVFYQGEL